MKKIISALFLISLFSVSSLYAEDLKHTTCYKQDNYDFEIDLIHSDGKLKAVTYNNSDWSTTGPELKATELYISDLTSAYSVDDGKILLLLETQVLYGKNGLVHSNTQTYNCH